MSANDNSTVVVFGDRGMLVQLMDSSEGFAKHSETLLVIAAGVLEATHKIAKADHLDEEKAVVMACIHAAQVVVGLAVAAAEAAKADA